MLLQAIEVAFHARQIRLGEQILFEFVIFDDEEFPDGFRQEFLRHRLAMVCERELDVERERLRMSGNPAKHGLGFVQLFIGQTRGGCANARLALEQLDLLNLTFRLGFRARREVFAEAFAVETGVELENDIP